MKISTVVFDFGNVLSFFSKRKAAQQLALHSDMAADTIEGLVWSGQLEESYEMGLLTTAQLLQELRQQCRLTGTDQQLSRAYADIFEANHDVCSVIPRLRYRYRLLLLSNTNELHYHQFSRQFADTLRCFDALVLSYQVGLRKPHPGIYDHCQKLASSPAEECLFIDDLPDNVAAARDRGWHGLVYRPGDNLAALLEEVGVDWESAPISFSSPFGARGEKMGLQPEWEKES